MYSKAEQDRKWWTAPTQLSQEILLRKLRNGFDHRGQLGEQRTIEILVRCSFTIVGNCLEQLSIVINVEFSLAFVGNYEAAIRSPGNNIDFDRFCVFSRQTPERGGGKREYKFKFELFIIYDPTSTVSQNWNKFCLKEIECKLNLIFFFKFVNSVSNEFSNVMCCDHGIFSGEFISFRFSWREMPLKFRSENAYRRWFVDFHKKIKKIKIQIRNHIGNAFSC